jgi:hypothetical protein
MIRLGPILLSGMLTGAAAVDPPRSPAALVNQAMRELQAEGEQSKRESALARQEATFARAFTQRQGAAVDPVLAWAKFTRPAHRDDLIDAYVRWQWTGFEPAPPTKPAGEEDFDDAAFADLLASLPAMTANPRSDRGMIARVNAALAREEVSESDASALAKLNEDLQTQAGRAADLNRPGLELRTWIERRFEDHPVRVHLLRLERIGAMVAAGWNVEDMKARFAAGIERSMRERELDADDRRVIAAAAARLAGRRTPIVTRVGAAEFAPEAEFDEAAVYDFEVKAWVRVLDGVGP